MWTPVLRFSSDGCCAMIGTGCDTDIDAYASTLRSDPDECAGSSCPHVFAAYLSDAFLASKKHALFSFLTKPTRTLNFSAATAAAAAAAAGAAAGTLNDLKILQSCQCRPPPVTLLTAVPAIPLNICSFCDVRALTRVFLLSVSVSLWLSLSLSRRICGTRTYPWGFPAARCVRTFGGWGE